MAGASGEALSLQRLGVVLTARGRLDEAQSVLGEGLAVAERALMRSHCLTRLWASVVRNRLAARDLPRAAESLDIGLDFGRRHGRCITCNALLLPEAIRVATAAGKVAESDAWAAELEDTARRFASDAWTAMARHARARVLTAQGRPEEAVAAFEAARTHYLSQGAVYDAARCRLGQARALGAGGRAASFETEAREVFERLGAAGIEE